MQARTVCPLSQEAFEWNETWTFEDEPFLLETIREKRSNNGAIIVMNTSKGVDALKLPEKLET